MTRVIIAGTQREGLEHGKAAGWRPRDFTVATRVEDLQTLRGPFDVRRAGRYWHLVERQAIEDYLRDHEQLGTWTDREATP